jgi:hypothetical protein
MVTLAAHQDGKRHMSTPPHGLSRFIPSLSISHSSATQVQPPAIGAPGLCFRCGSVCLCVPFRGDVDACSTRGWGRCHTQSGALHQQHGHERLQTYNGSGERHARSGLDGGRSVAASRDAILLISAQIIGRCCCIIPASHRPARAVPPSRTRTYLGAGRSYQSI